MMKKKLSLMMVILPTLTLISSMFIGTAKADVTSYSWQGYTFNGIDPFYGATYTIYAYETGSTAILIVRVENDYMEAGIPKPINVSAVGVLFDWNDAYNSTECSLDDPVTLEFGKFRNFAVSFSVPDTAKATNQYLHGYKVYVEHVNSTTGPKEVVKPPWEESPKQFPDFAVYSEDQADAQDLAQVLDALPLPTFTSARANLLVYRAQNETIYGSTLYMRGDFARAENHSSAALSLYNDAYLAEEEYGVKLEDLDITLAEAQVEYFESLGAAVAGLPIMFSLFGVSAVLFGVGYIVKQLATLKSAER
ncbi:MAG: hypothetical protein OEY83_03165 [Candidatus Bathyarchaeota archaeon]|nr:hypothetical protein [Candidatus Bathyarchaeota archaeon]